MTKFHVLVLACLSIIPNSLLSTETFSSIAVLAQTIIKSGWKTLDDRSDIKTNKTTEQKQARMWQKIRNVNEVLQRLEEPISSISYDEIFNVTLLAVKTTRNEALIQDFIWYMQEIDVEYNRLQQYSIEGDPAHFRTMINFAETAVSHEATSTKKLMEKLQQHIVPAARGPSGGVLKLVADNKDAFDEVVRTTGESPNQLLYNLFNKIALTQIKGYAVIQFSYVILDVYGQGYYTRESNLTNAEIRRTLQELSWETIRVTTNVTQHYWKNDPEEYKKGENYLEISRFLQGYIVNENILTKGICYGKCETYDENNVRKCQRDSVCREQTQCTAKVYNCRSVSAVNAQICLAPRNSTRRYDYIEYENHDVLGVKLNCTTPIMNVKGSMGRCPYCMCFCDDEGRSDRYFSLRQAKSDDKQNKVVTGIRFAKIDRMIYLQVQQGELLPYGVINATSLEWVPVDKFRNSDRYVYDKQDYLKMTWKDKSVDLHVIQVDNRNQNHQQQQVLTGVRLSTVQTGTVDKRTHLNLEIRMTKFHLKSGKLFIGKSSFIWFSNLNTEFSPSNPRTKIPTEDLDIPTRARSKNTIISKGNQFVEFTHTDVFKDAGQTTIPFIDSQDVVTKVPTPLVGAGLYYKSTPGYGGFIGLKIVTYDFTQHL